MQATRYHGNPVWEYTLGDETARGTVEIGYSANYRDDEAFARFHVRKKHGLNRLPAGTKVWPKTDQFHGKTLRSYNGSWVSAIGRHPKCVDCTRKVDGRCAISEKLDEEEEKLDREEEGPQE